MAAERVERGAAIVERLRIVGTKRQRLIVTGERILVTTELVEAQRELGTISQELSSAKWESFAAVDTQQLLPLAALDLPTWPTRLPSEDVLANTDVFHEARVHMPWAPVTADSDLMICMLPKGDR